MRRLLLMLPLALAVLALAPVASASAANTVSGACSIGGSAQFSPTGLQNTPQTMGYNFSGTGTCTGTLNGAPVVSAPVSAVASGSGTLSCAGAVSTGGSGTLTFSGGATVAFGVDLVGTGSEVEFVLTGNGGGAGVGHATFALNGTRVTECGNPGGLNNLGFNIAATAANLTG